MSELIETDKSVKIPLVEWRKAKFLLESIEKIISIYFSSQGLETLEIESDPRYYFGKIIELLERYEILEPNKNE